MEYRTVTTPKSQGRIGSSTSSKEKKLTRPYSTWQNRKGMAPHCLSRTSISAMDGRSPLQEKASIKDSKTFRPGCAYQLICYRSLSKQLERTSFDGLMKYNTKFYWSSSSKNYFYFGDYNLTLFRDYMGLSLQNANFHLKFKYFKYDCKPSNLYILRKFKKLVIVFLISKNTPNLINLSLFLKLKRKKKVKTVNRQKLKTKNLAHVL